MNIVFTIFTGIGNLISFHKKLQIKLFSCSFLNFISIEKAQIMREVCLVCDGYIIWTTGDTNYELFIPKLNFQFCGYFTEYTKLCFLPQLLQNQINKILMHTMLVSHISRELEPWRCILIKTCLTQSPFGDKSISSLWNFVKSRAYLW